MTLLILVALVSFAGADDSQSSNRSPKNVLLICIDDLRPELNCFGVDYILSPNIDGLAERGRAFTRHYVQAPTCGASRYTLLTGCYGPAGNGALFARAKKQGEFADGQWTDAFPPSLPAHFRQNGYKTVSVGKISHHPGGRGGPDWDDDSQLEMPLSWDLHLMPSGLWQHPRGAMHGLADGEIRIKAGEMDVYQSFDGPDESFPDGLITNEALAQMQRLASSSDEQPFFLAVGLIRPHLPFGAPSRYMEHYADAEVPVVNNADRPEGRTTWHRSGEFMKYNRWNRNPNQDEEFSTLVRKHYAACVTYVDAQVGRLLEKLEELEVADNTIVVLWGDHGWHLGERAIWGKHSLFEESLRSPLIIYHPAIESAGLQTDSVVETIDVFPTLCELTGLPIPDPSDGTSLVPLLRDPSIGGHTAVSYHGNARSIRTDRYRLVAHKEEFELYDFESALPGAENVAAEYPDVVNELSNLLDSRLER